MRLTMGKDEQKTIFASSAEASGDGHHQRLGMGQMGHRREQYGSAYTAGAPYLLQFSLMYKEQRIL